MGFEFFFPGSQDEPPVFIWKTFFPSSPPYSMQLLYDRGLLIKFIPCLMRFLHVANLIDIRCVILYKYSVYRLLRSY
jgi:hypothetical protein